MLLNIMILLEVLSPVIATFQGRRSGLVPSLILAFFHFDNSLLLTDETAISNLEFILFRHLPPHPQHSSSTP